MRPKKTRNYDSVVIGSTSQTITNQSVEESDIKKRYRMAMQRQSDAIGNFENLGEGQQQKYQPKYNQDQP